MGARGGGRRGGGGPRASASSAARPRARGSSGSRSRTRRGSRRSTRRGCLRTAGPSRTTRRTRPARAASGSGRSTRSTAQPLAGTEDTTRPFWSPDSRFLGFFAEGKLKKVDVSGGPPQKICDAPGGADGSWSPEGVILFDGTGNQPIHRVSAAGGTPVPAVKPDLSRKEAQVGWPEFLPDGKHFLYMAIGQKAEDNAYRIGTLDSAETKLLAPAQTLVTYAPAGLSPLRPRPDARRPALRREGPEDDGRADPAGRARRHGQRRPRSFLGVSRRDARVPDGRARRPVSLGGPLGQGGRGRRRPGRRPQPGLLSGRRPTRVRPRGSAERADRHLDSRSQARRQLPVHVRRRRRVLSPVVARRPPHGLHRRRRPLREGRRGPGRGEAPPQVGRAEGRDRLDPRRSNPRLQEPREGDGLGHLGHAHVRRQEAGPVPEDPVRGDERRRSRPTAASSRISRTSRDAPRSTSRASPAPGASGRSRRRAAGSRSGAPTARSCTTARSTRS